MEKQLTFIELFAGIGGFRLAFEKAGYKCLFASEIDKFCQKTYFANFNEYPQGDICLIDAKNIPDHDVLTAGFPCQPFSIANIPNSLRNNIPTGFDYPESGKMFFEIIRVLKEKQPKAFLLENVKNLVYYKKGEVFSFMLNKLKELGYYVHYKIINSQNYVPQKRERVFIVGFKGNVLYEFPVPPDKIYPVKDILEPEVDAKYTLSDRSWASIKARKLRRKRIDKKGNFGYYAVNLDRPSVTLTAHYCKHSGDILVPQKGKNPRRFTPRECARLMGFPDDFKIVVSDTQAYKQFGNSVVVPVVEALANSIKDHLINDL